MPRPIESLLSLPRVRLFDRVPILETENFVKRFMGQPGYTTKLVKFALEVSEVLPGNFPLATKACQHFSKKAR